MRKPIGKLLLLAVIACLISMAVYHIFSINRKVLKTLADERTRLIDKLKIPFEKKVLTPHPSQYVQIFQNTIDVRDIAEFRGFYSAATSGGLIQISPEGKTIRHFTVLDGLPESDLTRLAVFNDKLFIGTQTKGLMTFDGDKFESYTWPDRKSQAITALLPDGGDLFIGTFNGGLLKFDGADFKEIKAENERILAINCLLKDGSRMYVGTFNNGIQIYENDTWSHYSTAEGLPSTRVVGIAIKDGKLYAATDFGLAVLEDKAFKSVAVIPSLSEMAMRGDKLFLAKDDGEIYEFGKTLKTFTGRGGLQDSRFALAGEKLWLTSSQGISEVDNARLRPFVTMQNNELTDNFISAMTLDNDSKIWVGTFSHGLDLLSPGGEKIRHLENDDVREINFLDNEGGLVSAATTSGIVSFGKDFSIKNNLNKMDGLPSNSVNQFSGNTIATAKGLVLKDEGKLHVLSTVQNLPSNGVYTTLQTANKLYVGTLGGLAEIENRRVVRTLKDSNSGLTTNWVTALCLADERLFIGTYGGGIFELLPSGDVRRFEPETGKFVVNVNAMFSDSERMYVGTLNGVKILDLRTQQWRTLKSVLPAETVTSIAGTGQYVYFATTNGIAKIDKAYFVSGESE